MKPLGLCFKIDLVDATGPATCEIHRLCAGLVRVDVVCEPLLMDVDRLAVLRYVGRRQEVDANPARSSRGTVWSVERTERTERCESLCINVAFDDASAFASADGVALEHMNLAIATQRLALLARLAARARRATGDGRRATGDGRRATGDGRRATGDGRRATFAAVPLFEFVATIQLGFSLRLTVHELSHRLGIDVSTLRRWFYRAGPVAPERFMQWVRLNEVAMHLADSTESVEHVVLALGFSSASNVRRALQRLAGVAPQSLRRPEGFALFLRRMSADLRRPHHNRASMHDSELFNL